SLPLVRGRRRRSRRGGRSHSKVTSFDCLSLTCVTYGIKTRCDDCPSLHAHSFCCRLADTSRFKSRRLQPHRFRHQLRHRPPRAIWKVSLPTTQNLTTVEKQQAVKSSTATEN